MKRDLRRFREGALVAGLTAGCLLGSAVAHAASPSPIYVHMNGLNDFLPKVVFVRPGQPVTFVNQDQGSHSIHGYSPVGGSLMKGMDEQLISGTPGPGHPVHTYTVTFNRIGVHYYLCTVHAHLVKIYQPPSGEGYFLPARRARTNGYTGSMAGVVIVTKEAALLESDPPITHERLLPRFWNNGDVKGG